MTKYSYLASLAAALVITACSEAQSEPASEATAPNAQTVVAENSSAPSQDSSSDMSVVDDTVTERADEVRVERGLERRFMEAMEEGFETQMLLFTRVSPEAADAIKPITMTADDRKILKCAFDGAKKAGLADHIQYGVEQSDKLTALVKANPSLSMATLDDNPEAYALMTAQLSYGTEAEQDQLQAINAECGVMGMMMAKMRDSGAMDVMMNAAMDEGDDE